MSLEETILALTSQTPCGGRFRIGDASIRVWFCSDIWEWEYRGETFWDALDLAEALGWTGATIHRPIPPLPQRTGTEWPLAKTKPPVDASWRTQDRLAVP